MSLRNKIVGALAGASLLGGGITAVIQNNEGYSSTAYRDSAGVPTICYGETKGVQMGQKRSLSDCQKQLIESAGEYAKALVGLPESLPDVPLLGSLDLAYNVGVAGFNSSTPKRELAKGNYKAAGKAVLEWRYISKKQRQSPGVGWEWRPASGKWIFDCSQYINGKPNKVCYGIWKRRLWQSKAIGNEFKSVQEAVAALPK
jgi:GH24 family phage-related lysozyme (muramidase)